MNHASVPTTAAKEDSLGGVEGEGRFFRAGTLVYTRAGLFALFAWMLWGDFCFTLMESVVPRVLPLQLKELNASNAVIAFLVTSMPGLMNMLIVPVVSWRSDRVRTRWGRRIPFLLAATPPLALCLVAIGFAPEIAGVVDRLPVLGGAGETAVALGVLGVLVFCFQFFNMFVSSVYYYLFNDVVPKELIGRFMAMFRVVGTLAGVVFTMFVYGHSATHTREIYVGAAVLYLVAFLLMCWRVREGEYPPPPGDTGKPGFFGAGKTYFRQCFSLPIYWCLFLGMAFWFVGNSAATFHVFFARDLGMSLDAFGKLTGWMLLLQSLLIYPAGWLADRVHPLRLMFGALVAVPPLALLVMFGARTPESFFVLFLLLQPVYAIIAACSLPLYMVLLPQERYGQFASAGALVNSVCMIFGTWLGGQFLDWTGSYRHAFLWWAVFGSAAAVLIGQVLRIWKQMGGTQGYVPPVPGISTAV